MKYWVSVVYELPKNSTRVLCYDSNLKNSLCGYYDEVNKTWIVDHNRNNESVKENNITHWMHLPVSPSCAPDSSCNTCFHNCGDWCDFDTHCLKKFGEPDSVTNERLRNEVNKDEEALD